MWEIANSKYDMIKILNAKFLYFLFSYDEASYKMYENLFNLKYLL